MDRKKALLEALRGVDREALLAVLADVLAGGERSTVNHLESEANTALQGHAVRSVCFAG